MSRASSSPNFTATTRRPGPFAHPPPIGSSPQAVASWTLRTVLPRPAQSGAGRALVFCGRAQRRADGYSDPAAKCSPYQTRCARPPVRNIKHPRSCGVSSRSWPPHDLASGSWLAGRSNRIAPALLVADILFAPSANFEEFGALRPSTRSTS